MTLSEKVAEQAHLVTYGGAAGSVTFWGLHVSEMAAIVSAIVAVCGLGIQIYVALARLRYLRQQHREETHDTATPE